MDDIPGTIIENRQIAANYFFLTVRLSRPMGEVMPGQFLMARLPGNEVFLRRPFSICRARGKDIGIMYKVVGKGTEILSRACKQQEMLILGPLGKGFHIAERTSYFIVAGGIGLAGVLMLAERLGGRARVFFGCGTRTEIALAAELAGNTAAICTLDGTHGFCGSVIELLAKNLREYSNDSVEIYACGPDGMFRALRAVLEKARLPCQVLVEERMACGLGLCFGCAKKTLNEKEPYKRVCKEGPVFDLWELCL
jgi:dihydroorotate dehydrogenase electron transfer subunit